MSTRTDKGYDAGAVAWHASLRPRLALPNAVTASGLTLFLQNQSADQLEASFAPVNSAAREAAKAQECLARVSQEVSGAVSAIAHTSDAPENSVHTLATAIDRLRQQSRPLSAALEGRAMSARATSLGERDAPAHAIADFTLSSRNFIEGTSLALTVRNMFDTKYSDPSSVEHEQNAIRQDGRSFWFRAGYHF